MYGRQDDSDHWASSSQPLHGEMHHEGNAVHIWCEAVYCLPLCSLSCSHDDTFLTSELTQTAPLFMDMFLHLESCCGLITPKDTLSYTTVCPLP